MAKIGEAAFDSNQAAARYSVQILSIKMDGRV